MFMQVVLCSAGSPPKNKKIKLKREDLLMKEPINFDISLPLKFLFKLLFLSSHHLQPLVSIILFSLSSY